MLAGAWSLQAQHVLTHVRQGQSHDLTLKFGVNYMQLTSVLALKSHSSWALSMVSSGG